MHQLIEQVQVSSEMLHIGPRDLDVRLRAHHLRLPQQILEEGPTAGHSLHAPEPVARRHRFAEGGADAQPTGEHEPDLGPAESPRYRADSFDARLRTRAIRWT